MITRRRPRKLTSAAEKVDTARAELATPQPGDSLYHAYVRLGFTVRPREAPPRTTEEADRQKLDPADRLATVIKARQAGIMRTGPKGAPDSKTQKGRQKYIKLIKSLEKRGVSMGRPYSVARVSSIMIAVREIAQDSAPSQDAFIKHLQRYYKK